MNYRKIKIIVVASIFLSSVFVAGCSNRGEIEGTIVDAFDNPLADVSVQLVGSDFMSLSEKNGAFSIEYVPGKFVVEIRKSGYTTHKAKLELHQNSVYPLGKVKLFPIPEREGIFWLNHSLDQLVEVPIQGYFIELEDRTIGMMQSEHIYRAWPNPEKLAGPSPEGLDIPEGTAEFIDTIPAPVRLMRSAKYNIIYRVRLGPGNPTIVFDDSERGESTQVGEEQLLVRTFRLKPYGYHWVIFTENMFGHQLPLRDSPTRNFIVKRTE